MARAPNEKLNKALSLYQKGYKLVDIAKELDIPVGTIRSWKNRYKWSCDEGCDESATLQKDNKNKCNVAKEKNNKKSNEKEPIAEEVKEVLENTELTDKQRLFCIYYIKHFNATKAYKEVYECDYKSATVSGPRLLGKVSIKKEIQRLTKECLEEEEVEAKLLNKRLFEMYMKIAFADIGDYLRFGQEEEKVWNISEDGSFKPSIDPETGEQKVRKYNVINLNESSEVDTSIISEVSEGKDGVKVKLLDKMKALEWLDKHYGEATPEQQAKIDKLKAETLRLNPPETIIDGKPFELPARVIAPPYLAALYDIEDKEHREYIFYGGRGSTKSSFVGLEIINLIKKNPTMHALACRQVSNTLKDSVYNQIKWAISALDLDDEFYCTVSPIEITYKPTGQKIFFRGADDPTKIKSIKPPFGYIGILWLEELDQFAGPEAVRSIEQSAIRGGDDAYIFKSFNPPKTANNWANKYIKIPKDNQYQLHTTYLDVPKKWLGKTFIEEAEHLKEVNPTAYGHEYLGIANGNGGNVFDNVVIREITDEEIKEFDRIYHGVDWGYYPDKYAYTKSYFDAARRKLYIYDEYCCNKKSNKETYTELVENHGVTPNDLIICDSAEPKSIGDYKSYGLFARGAEKGPDSVNYSMKWLQSLNEIIIDNRRAPNCATEFMEYEYERDKNGDVISGYPDKNNHCIDSVRYGLNNIWKKRGQ
ncbi:PBSX family phage terminase large subunit [uncultured Clostridium sp.]|uniref:PBSX family phage terminase large subunit n=1 Tax=uncultured Clostridium sp. TaxID=59620 RepID=UPI0025E049DF|nr:PBSX family phage terminase large subunit [uncultured Clostridium sp.]